MVGVAKFKPGHAGNAAAYEEILADAKKDEDPLIQKAGAAAESFTREQLHRLK